MNRFPTVLITRRSRQKPARILLACGLAVLASSLSARDANSWPFSRYSIWNMPVGDGAQYSSTPAYPVTYSPDDGYGVDTEPWVPYNASNPQRQVWKENWNSSNFTDPVNAPAGGLTNTGTTVRLPDDYLVQKNHTDFIGSTPNLGGAVGISSTVIQEYNYFVRPDVATYGNSNRNVYIVGNGIRGTLNIYGSGAPETSSNKGAHGGSMLSAKGGSITADDLLGSGPIRHAWKMTADLHAIGKLDSIGQNSHVWPAIGHDGDDGNPTNVGTNEAFYGKMTRSPYNWYSGFTPTVSSGSLLAIPYSLDIEELGIVLDPVKKLAYAAQRFGVYVVDCVGQNPDWHQNLICMEYGTVEALQNEDEDYNPLAWNNLNSQWQQDMNTLILALHVVQNNSATSIGGGGDPLYCMAPDFTDGGTDLISSNPNGAVTEPTGCNPSAPDVTLTAPAGEASYNLGQTVNLAATAVDDDGIALVEFYRDGVFIDDDNTPPFAAAWTPSAAGSYVLTAKAFDGATPIQSATSPGVDISVIDVGGLPGPWDHADLGAVGVVGDATHDNGTFTLDGSGEAVWYQDNVHFVYQSLTGDMEITARVVSIENTSSDAKAGVTIRESLDADAMMAMVDLTPGIGVEFRRRTSTAGAPDVTTDSGYSPAHWVKLVRSGDVFSAYRSPDGTSWTQVGSSATVSMTSAVYVGLAVCSRDNAELCTSVFDNVVIGAVSNNVPAITTASLPDGTMGAAYSQSLVASGGDGALVWSLDTGSLPAGLSLSAAGVISGTPTASGTSVFTVRVADSDGNTGTSDEDTAALSIIVDVGAGSTVYQAEDSTLTSVTVATGNAGYTGSGYIDYPSTWGNIEFAVSVASAGSYTIELRYANGDGSARTLTRTVNGTGSTPVSCPSTGGWASWGVVSASVSLNSGSNTIKFMGPGSSPGGPNVDKLTVVGGANSVPAITTSSLPGGTTGVAYSQTLAATGGDGTLLWSLDTGSLPAGLSLSSAGVISGTPSGTGTSSFTVRVEDSDGNTGGSDEDTRSLSIQIVGSTVHQAESASLTSVAVNTGNANYTGSGYGDYPSTWGNIEFSVTVPTTGTYTLKLRYANGDGSARTLTRLINGSGSTTVSCPSSGGWATWAEVTADVTLNSGSNTIKFTGPGSSPGGPNVDKLTVVGPL